MTLAQSEFKLRYFGSALGYLWSLMRPLLFFGVLYLFFTVVLDVGKGVPHYGVYLLTGIVLWNYVAEATGNAVPSLVTREALLRKVRFPRMVVPLSVSLTAIFNLAMNSIAVVVFALASGLTPNLAWIEMIPIMLAFVVLATGLALLLSAMYVRHRDVAPIWEVALQAWFYCTPVMYTAAKVATSVRFPHWIVHVVLLNPAATLLTQMGHALIGGRYFRTATDVGGVPTVVVALTIIPCVFALGWWFFAHEAPQVAENL